MKASELHDLRENCAGSSSKSMVSWGQAFHRLPLKTGPAILAQTTPTQRVAVLTVSCKPGEEVIGRPLQAGRLQRVGAPAGQTVMHCHIHLIPRRSRDSVNPRGGVQGVIAGKAD